MNPLPRSFYDRGAQDVAPEVLGKFLCHRTPSGVQRARIVETEAYVGEHDLACHAAKGRTARTAVLYGPPGHAYVYLVYGMHHLLNLVTSEEGDPQAVLIRGVLPQAGWVGRGDGPGRLTASLGIRVQSHNRLDLCGPRLWLEAGAPPTKVEVTPRIGVEYAGKWARAPLRFVAADAVDTHAHRRSPVESSQ